MTCHAFCSPHSLGTFRIGVLCCCPAVKLSRKIDNNCCDLLLGCHTEVMKILVNFCFQNCHDSGGRTDGNLDEEICCGSE